MLGQFRSTLTITVVMTIIHIASSQISQAQMLRKLLEGPSESKPATSNPQNRNTPDPRQTSANAQANRNGYAPNTQNRNTPTLAAPRPQSGAQRSQPTAPRPQPKNTPPQFKSNIPQPPSNAPQAPSRTQQPAFAPQRSQSPGTQPLSSMNRAPSTNQRAVSKIAPPGNVGNRPTMPNAPFQPGPIEPPTRTGAARSVLSDRLEPISERNDQDTENSTAQKQANPSEVLSRFGLNLVEKEDRLYVVRVDRNGNASAAGMREGDSIVSLGGAPIANQKEFTEIAGLLSEGDQIELVLNREGKEEKAFIQYGQSRELPAEQEPEGPTELRLQDSNWSASPDNDDIVKLKEIVEHQRNVIAELQERLRELESSRGKSAF